jgi:hypothetical protein
MFKILSSDDDQSGLWHKYEVTSRKQIVPMLNEIRARCESVRISVDNEVVCQSFVRTVDEFGGSLIIAGSSDPERNARIAGAGGLVLETAHDRIRIVFTCAGVEPVGEEPHLAFKLPIPSSVLRMLRRDGAQVPIVRGLIHP